MRVFTSRFLSVTILSILLIALRGNLMADDKSAGETLHALFDAEWEWKLRQEPTFASHLGDLRYNDRWPDLSLKAIADRHAHRQGVLRRLKEFDYDALSEADKVNYRLFRHQYENDIESYKHRWHLLPMNQRDGIQDVNSLADSLWFRRVKDYEDWIARLRKLPPYMDQTIALMREGIRTGRVHAKVVIERVPDQVRKQLVEDPADSPFFKPFRTFPEEIAAVERERLAQEAKQAIEKDIVPAYRRLLEFVEKEYLPACYERAGVWQFPNGKELYEFSARRHTTTNLTPREIHEIGLKEVARIRGEMEKIIEEVGFDGSFKEFCEFLRTDPRFYFKSENELLDAYRSVCKKVDPQLVRLFRKLPRIPYGVEAIPMQMAPDTTTAYYRPPAADGSRAGTYFVNLYKLEARPKYEIEALSLHEAVPGHHLQIALAMELEDLPTFRRFAGYTAYIEGWALYAESLGDELGLYEDPYSRFGRLTYEMWRAVRLVVDTGMHYFQWPRQKAIDFFADNTAKTMHDIENEIDRYIAWPGQALAYKIGELKIKELRSQAEKALGEKFDVRDFHEVLLSSGAVTLDVLEGNVEAWIERTAKK